MSILNVEHLSHGFEDRAIFLGMIKPLEGSVEQGDYLSIGYFEQEMPQDISTSCMEE